MWDAYVRNLYDRVAQQRHFSLDLRLRYRTSHSPSLFVQYFASQLDHPVRRPALPKHLAQVANEKLGHLPRRKMTTSFVLDFLNDLAEGARPPVNGK
jgi:hypothetical protein